MKYAYSPDTGEIIHINPPSAWMGTTDVAPPVFDTATAGCFWRGTAWEIVVAPPPPVIIPAQVSMRQARLALLQGGLLTTVNGAIAAMTGIQGQTTQIEWEFASTVDRKSPLLAQLSTSLGWTSAQLDTLFTLASTL